MTFPKAHLIFMVWQCLQRASDLHAGPEKEFLECSRAHMYDDASSEFPCRCTYPLQRARLCGVAAEADSHSLAACACEASTLCYWQQASPGRICDGEKASCSFSLKKLAAF